MDTPDQENIRCPFIVATIFAKRTVAAQGWAIRTCSSVRDVRRSDQRNSVRAHAGRRMWGAPRDGIPPAAPEIPEIESHRAFDRPDADASGTGEAEFKLRSMREYAAGSYELLLIAFPTRRVLVASRSSARVLAPSCAINFFIFYINGHY